MAIILVPFLMLLASSSGHDFSGGLNGHSPLDNAPLFAAPPVAPTVSPKFMTPMPKCETACQEHIRGVINMVVTPQGRLSDTRKQVCSHYNKAMECFSPLTQCTDSLFPHLSSGIRYMCVEQKDAFDILVNCVDDTTPTVKKECELTCNPSSLATGLAVKDTFLQSFDQPLLSEAIQVNVKDLLEPHIGRIAVSEGCRITQCMLQCFKTKFNTRCEGTAGTLIMEMLTRPFTSETQTANLGTQVLSAFLNGMMPQSCSLIADKAKMKIDPELDADIKRMYAKRRNPEPSEFQVLSQPADKPNPFSMLPIIPDQIAAFDKPFVLSETDDIPDSCFLTN